MLNLWSRASEETRKSLNSVQWMGFFAETIYPWEVDERRCHAPVFKFGLPQKHSGTVRRCSRDGLASLHSMSDLHWPVSRYAKRLPLTLRG
jgi:hypothetical protein